ncbi:MAG: DUF393 domain-containing protein [Gemmatimonadaceae bacterium]|nr:DUF393 domain-containing protein [Gemmatimonadaceae bacterium]
MIHVSLIPRPDRNAVARPATVTAPHDKVDLRALIDTHGYVVLYDGVCGLCNGFVQWVLARDPSGTMRFATLQGPIGDAARRALPQIADVDSVVVLYKDGAWVKSTAALEVARYVGGAWAIAVAAYVIPRVVRDAVYDAIARRRYGWFGRYDSCPIPTPEQRARFLD